MKPDSPTISVIIPTRDRDDLLSACLDRLAPGAQTLPAEQYEVIVSDDGDSEATEQMLRKRYPWVLYTRGPRRGPAANRNNGARHARAQWIAFVDDDCLPQPAWLKAYADAIVADIHVYEGRTTCVAGLHSPLYIAPVNLTGGWLWSCNLLVRRQVFCDLGGFDERFLYPFMEDVDFRERLRSRMIQFAFVHDAVVDHPPRRLPSGRVLGRYHQSDIIFGTKRGRCPSLKALIRSTAVHRLRQISHFPISQDMFIGLANTLVELATVATQYRRWKIIEARRLREGDKAMSQSTSAAAREAS